MRAGWILAVTAVLMLVAGVVLIPLPDPCDGPGSLVMCRFRSSAAGLTFPRASLWPVLEALGVLLAIAVVGGLLAVRAHRRQRAQVRARRPGGSPVPRRGR